MLEKGWAASVALLCIIVACAILAAGSQPKPVLIGYFAELIFPVLLMLYLLVLPYSARAITDILASVAAISLAALVALKEGYSNWLTTQRFHKWQRSMHDFNYVLSHDDTDALAESEVDRWLIFSQF
jgi:hypothetical protein